MEPYSTRKKERSAKIPKEIDCEMCYYKSSIFSPQERDALCRYYWTLSFIEKNNFILNNVTVDATRRVLAVRGRKKQRQYIKICFFVHNREKKQVCQKLFCHTLAISPSVVKDPIRKRNDLGLYNDKDS